MSGPTSPNSSRPRQKAPIDSRLDRSLAAYVAAGLGILVLATPAQAKVVYTPDDQQIPNGLPGNLSLDLNHDGISDFIFSNFYSSTSSTLDLSIDPVRPANEIFSTGANLLSVFAAALPAGAEIGPNGNFKKRIGEGMANGEDLDGVCQGPWIHGHNRYLGLKFVIEGEVHFGWARLDVDCLYPHAVEAKLTGYAYETVANAPIIAGATNDSEVSASPGTLSSLAIGTAAISNEPGYR